MADVADRPHWIVVNPRAQYSVWPADRPLPDGWRPVGEPSDRASCLAEIARRFPAWPVGPRPSEVKLDPAPTTRAQRWRFAIHRDDLATPGKPPYMQHGYLGLRLAGSLDGGALRSALDALVARHTAFRIGFVEHDGRVAQVIHRSVSIPLEEIDLTQASEAERDRVTAAEVRRPFDLARPPLVRAQLQAIAADVHHLVLTSHLIAFDGWSQGVVLDELWRLYDHHVATRRGDPLPPPELQACDLGALEEAWLASPEAGAERAYWSAVFATPTTPVNLPPDHPNPAQLEWGGRNPERRLDAATGAALCALGGDTLFVVLLAAYVALLHRRTGTTDVTVSTSLAGRDGAAAVTAVGDLTNLVLLRVAVDPTTTFRELLVRARQATRGAFAHQRLPCPEVVALLDPPAAPLAFARLLLYYESPPLPHCSLALSDIAIAWNNVELMSCLVARSDASGIVLWLPSRIEYYELKTLESALEELVALLGAAAQDPDLPVGRLTAPAIHQA